MNFARLLLATALALLGVGTAAALAQPPAGKGAPRVLLATSAGDITLELDAERAPKTVENFLAYVRAGHYDGTIFHRVIDGFMIQGGGFTPDMRQKPTRAPIALESRNGLKNVRGAIAMARTAVPDSATSQFFINVVDNPRLDYPNPDGHGYAVFGRVVAGMDVVDKIRTVATGNRDGHQNVPLAPVVIRSAKILQ
jgi:peptidyl-prolyl cis-trans isomerase A (cyclophilin A)